MERIRFRKKDPLLITDAQAGNLCRIAFEMAKEDAERIRELKDAILRGDTDNVYRIGAKICGLEDFFRESHGDWYEASDRIS
jgi:hypothetical protein